MGVLESLFCCVVLDILSSFGIILLSKREDWLHYVIVDAYVLCLFLMVTLAGMQSVIVAVPGHTRFFVFSTFSKQKIAFFEF